MIECVCPADLRSSCNEPQCEHSTSGNVLKDAGPFQANACRMPEPVEPHEAVIYRNLRNHLIKAHCADNRPAHKCAGEITINRTSITFQCPRCGDARKIIEDQK